MPREFKSVFKRPLKQTLRYAFKVCHRRCFELSQFSFDVSGTKFGGITCHQITFTVSEQGRVLLLYSGFYSPYFSYLLKKIILKLLAVCVVLALDVAFLHSCECLKELSLSLSTVLFDALVEDCFFAFLVRCFLLQSRCIVAGLLC
jgi:hypothetical protein